MFGSPRGSPGAYVFFVIVSSLAVNALVPRRKTSAWRTAFHVPARCRDSPALSRRKLMPVHAEQSYNDAGRVKTLLPVSVRR